MSGNAFIESIGGENGYLEGTYQIVSSLVFNPPSLTRRRLLLRSTFPPPFAAYSPVSPPSRVPLVTHHPPLIRPSTGHSFNQVSLRHKTHLDSIWTTGFSWWHLGESPAIPMPPPLDGNHPPLRPNTLQPPVVSYPSTYDVEGRGPLESSLLQALSSSPRRSPRRSVQSIRTDIDAESGTTARPLPGPALPITTERPILPSLSEFNRFASFTSPPAQAPQPHVLSDGILNPVSGGEFLSPPPYPYPRAPDPQRQAATLQSGLSILHSSHTGGYAPSINISIHSPGFISASHIVGASDNEQTSLRAPAEADRGSPDAVQVEQPSSAVNTMPGRKRRPAAAAEPEQPRGSPTTGGPSSKRRRKTETPRPGSQRDPSLRVEAGFSEDHVDSNVIDIRDATDVPEFITKPPRKPNSVKLGTFQCVICMDDVTQLTVTHCGHLFCLDCLDASLHTDYQRNKCPICRQKIECKDRANYTTKTKGYWPLELKIMTATRSGKRTEQQ